MAIDWLKTRHRLIQENRQLLAVNIALRQENEYLADYRSFKEQTIEAAYNAGAREERETCPFCGSGCD